MAASPAMEKLRSMVATSAIHDGERGGEDYTGECLPGTREMYLQLLSDWADKGPSERRVEWVKGVAGAGKTAMTRSFCDLLENTLRLPVASFFIWKSDGKRNTLRHFPATIASQLARAIPALVPTLERAINEDPFLLQSSFKKQMNKLVINPLLDACDAVKQGRHVIIVVDGLDEVDMNGQQELLEFIPYLLSRLSSLPVSLFITSRPESQITGAFNRPDLNAISSRLTLEESEADILLFLLAKFKAINDAFLYLAKRYGKWPNEDVIPKMVKLSSGFFIWPTVAMNYIMATGQGLRHNERLELVLSSSSVEPWKDNIDKLYRAILMAHAPLNPAELDRFKRRLALLCLPVGGAPYIATFEKHTLDCSHPPLSAVFGETPEEVWDAVADLSSLFKPKDHLSDDSSHSPLPTPSHRSFRDFTFNRARCGDYFYYCNEQDLHTEVVCKFIDAFNTGKAYKDWDLNGRFIHGIGIFLHSHLNEAALTEDLGRCMDDASLTSIPSAWPLLAQFHLATSIFEEVFCLALKPEFPRGAQRRRAFLSKLAEFYQVRSAAAQRWDISLLRLTPSHSIAWYIGTAAHSVQCQRAARGPNCKCINAFLRYRSIEKYTLHFQNSTLAQALPDIALPKQWSDAAQDRLSVLLFILSIGETSEPAVELSAFVPVRSDYWFWNELEHCPPDQHLFNALVPICTGASSADRSIHGFRWQTDAFKAYTERCRKAGIEINNAPSIYISEDREQHEETGPKSRELGSTRISAGGTSHSSSSDSSDDEEEGAKFDAQLATKKPPGDALRSSDGREGAQGARSVDVGKTSPGIPPPQIPDAAYTSTLQGAGKGDRVVLDGPQNPVGPLRRGRFRRFFKKLAFWD